MTTRIVIPDPPPTGNRNLDHFLQVLKEKVEVMAGERGEASKRCVTVEDLVDYGLIEEVSD